MSEPRRLRQKRLALQPAIDVAVLVLAALAVFWPVLRHGFVNWDDPVVLVDNPHLGSPGIASWAFSTTLIGHYQPLAWLAWSAAKSRFGLSPAAFHGLSLAVHIANGIVVYALTLDLSAHGSFGLPQRRAAALIAGLIFLLHPASVETVAWASAFPYVLSLLALLLSFLAYVRGRVSVSIALYAASLLTRATAIGYPIVLLVADLYPLKRNCRVRLHRLVLEKAPFVVLATVAAAAEWLSRDVASLQEIGLVPRITMAATAPFVYAWRTLWPVKLSPLNPLPISPTSTLLPLAIGIAGVITITALAWRLRYRWPLLAAAWVIYATLLAPIAGLTPSGLQATADRYMYVPSVVVAILTGSAVASEVTMSVVGAAVAVTITTVIVSIGALTWNQTQYWKTSITLWTRAAELDPRDDIATYNLAIALAEAGREEEAINWYKQTIALVPDHDLARRNLALLQAANAERNADRLATAGHGEEAFEEYTRAIALDARRSHARAARGMLMVQRGQLREATMELRLAIEGGIKDIEVPNALAFALVQTGETSQAATVLTRALTEHPNNVNLKHNLARLLATASDPQVRDGPRALRLALEVCEQTANHDPRALDTLSAAYAAVGRFDMARVTATSAVARAREIGDLETAAEIAAHARSYHR